MADGNIKGFTPSGTASRLNKPKPSAPAKSSDVLASVLKLLDSESAGELSTRLQTDGFNTAPVPTEPEKPQVVPEVQVLKEVASRPQTGRIPGAIGSTAQSAPPGWARNLAEARIEVWAIPGSTVRLYNASFLENGQPKLLQEVVAPLNEGAAVSTEHLPNHLPELATDFRKAAESFALVPHSGMVLTSISLHPHAAQDALDIFLVTQQTGARAESEPQSLTLVRSSHLDARPPRPLAVDYSKLAFSNGVLSATADYALPAGALLTVRQGGLTLWLEVVADEKGRFSLDLSNLPNLDELVIGLDCGSAAGSLDLEKLGIKSSSPPTQERVLNWDHAVMKGMLVPGENEVGFTLDPFPEELMVVVLNPSDPGEAQVFYSSGGKLDVRIKNAMPGDVLNVTFGNAEDTVGHGWTDDRLLFEFGLPGQEGSGGQPFTVEGTYLVPSSEQQAQIGKLMEVFKGLPRDQLQGALELFGPNSKVTGAPDVSEPERLRTVYEGAILGAAAHWIQAGTVRQFVEWSKNPDLVRGFDLGVAYAKATGHSLSASMESAGFHLVKGHQGFWEYELRRPDCAPQKLHNNNRDALTFPPVSFQKFGLQSNEQNGNPFTYAFPIIRR